MTYPIEVLNNKINDIESELNRIADILRLPNPVDGEYIYEKPDKEMSKTIADFNEKRKQLQYAINALR